MYSLSSNIRNHTTISFTVNAAGGMVEPWVIFPGVRDIVKNKMKLPTNGRTGMWRYYYTSNRWVNKEIYIDILMDLVRYIKNQEIPIPVILFIDGASCYLSIDMAEFCKLNGIQPILLRPNTTHLCQALDLTFFASLKANLKIEQELWHCDPKNIGSTLNKYTFVNLVCKVAETIMNTKPYLISKGVSEGWDLSLGSRSSKH